MKIIGITGGVGAGKTQILEYLSDKYGASVCQTDKVAKKLQKKGGICYDPIVEHFGTEILDEKGELDRKKLSDIVFGDPKELSVLNEIVHPAVKEEVNKNIIIERVKIINEEGENAIGKPIGNYVTVDVKNLKIARRGRNIKSYRSVIK